MTLTERRSGGVEDAGALRPEQVSFGNLNNIREAIAIAAERRTIAGLPAFRG
ncbi:hypothetical protein [Cryptosporangium minutisporangium]|uniref:Uncharacterized protein n=1 Tax=Cryptosporangium minutisporangium TaxID=113569 RepID=A0ABP6T4A6_9ACTN